MIANPANYAAGLLDERDAAVRAGNERVVADIDAELEAVRSQLEEFDPTGVDEEAQRKSVAAVRRRLAAFDRGEADPAAPATGEPRVHNAANYMTGLLDERDAAVRAGRPTDDIDAEIEKVRPHLEAFQPLDDENGDARAHYAGIRRRLSKLGTTPAPADAAPEGGEREQDKAPRTTKAAAPPRRTGTRAE